MKILNKDIESKIDSNIITALLHLDYNLAVKNITEIFGCLYNSIPKKNRISYGRVFTIKVLSEYLYNHLRQNGVGVFQIASTLFTKSENFKNKGVALGILSYYGLDDFHKVLPILNPRQRQHTGTSGSSRRCFSVNFYNSIRMKKKNFYCAVRNQTTPIYDVL